MTDSLAANSKPLDPAQPVPPALATAAPVPRAAPLPGEVIGLFYGQLSGLLKAGMPMPQALRTLAHEAGARPFRAALERAATALDKGCTPEDAFRAEECELGGMLGCVTAASAASGELPRLLAELSAWTLNQERIRRKLFDALLYPFSVLILTSALALVFTTIARAWNTYGEPFTRDRSAVEQILLPNFSCEAAQVFIACVLGACLAVPLTSMLSRFSTGLRRWRERLLLRLPVLGSVCRPLALSRFCGCVAILMRSGRSYHEAVAAAGPLSGFAPYADAAAQAAQKLRAGETQAETWANPRLFPASLRFIVSSAEVRGDLPDAFVHLSELYQTEAEGRARILAVLAPPVFFVIVGLVVTVMFCGILNPLFRALEMMIR